MTEEDDEETRERDPLSEFENDVQDPFSDFESDVEGRQGDPFEEFEQPGQEQPTGAEESATADTADSRPDGVSDQQEFDWSTPAESPPALERGKEHDSFMGGFRREGDPFEHGSPFEEVDVGHIDPDRVWQDLTGAQSRGSVTEGRKRTYADVSKHAYCEQCEHFTEPPRMECEHEGTEIVEFRDMETVRVVDCPIVAEREALERETGKRSVELNTGKKD